MHRGGANSRAPRQAALHGLWYVAVEKAGTQRAYSSLQPWADYKPQKEWRRSLWDWHKLDHAAYLRLSAERPPPRGPGNPA